MSPFISFLLAGFIFFFTHVALSSTSLRGKLSDQLGEAGYLGLYSVVATVTFAWFIVAFSKAPVISLWPPALWTRWVPVVVLPFATILVVGGYTTPNPTAVGMEHAAKNDDPAPGMLRITRHPILWGVGLWALSHIPPNGDLASVIFFGVLAVLALGGTVLVDRKKRLALGSNWPHFAELTSNLPFAALLAGRNRLRYNEMFFLHIVAGLLLYAVLLLAHPLYTSYSALPL
jgi:uncharacterized membrane protein